MATCEMCGNEVSSLRRATVEGTAMNVCGSCVKFGVEIAGPRTEVTGRSTVAQSLERRAQRSKSRDIYSEMQEELKPEYPQIVRDARNRAGLTTKDLAERLKESELTIKHVESGSLHPPDTLVKKLERELGVKLMERPETPEGVSAPKSPNRALTLGDLLKKELEKARK